ncbi:branched-chain amino acid ABC transporter substrate-binding protein [Anoxybacillus rupiensis]|jgi:branched-chain amino acid transport system substrate-binding protein|uniref:Branched-chain amino acid ABC transporter substrate-binding protein n=1 Tax=Anoxybacteroides rupiense TaxID=311460 RepID=A0ABD5IXC8_9BACL|nr:MULTISPECIES: branched-chain amino acid ABC transporter substrate-binding protein [Anoxybacillus]KXG08592.1 Leucine-, isoleucine-, valine-, threonine-, and alanine-binding protein [Anoxybacillus sp. P3H1B]MBB3908223.1 branched-chain amino acid transport system substrate-binding protein [Anoxybacillus rupiensis]MBS2772352.1 branched-chain amino acid ABC transporter substrate-binding protein [Anoxybacillus rupiensis]MDE8563960.1 branched-chain amino acid ABC transporter substrate-binding prote
MVFKKTFSILATATLAVGLLAGCSGGNKDQNASNGGSGGSSGSNVIKIATQTPLSGGSATLGESIKLGAQLALEEQQANFEKLGFKLELVPYDDQGDPKKGVANAQLIGADKQIFGVVGHLNSGVAIPSSEIYEKYSIPMVSPANTATDVTDRGLKTVNRICARDDFQGPAGAKFAIEKLGAKKIFIIQDKTAYGSGLAEAFKKGAEDLGAQVVGFEGITVGEKDFNGVLNQVLAKKPDLVYFGGLYTEGGQLIKQARDKGITVPIMGGDGLDSSTLVQIAGDAVKNVYMTSAAGLTTATDAGKQFAEKYKQKFGKDIESYSAYGYDSMGVLLKGIENAIKENGNKLPSRQQVAEGVRKVQEYEGVVTKVSFDEKGDNKYAKIYIYKFDEAKYPAKLEDEVSKQ